MALTIHQVDAFTEVPYRGNPAGVCVLPGPADEDWMQRVASEMNLSETAFLHPVADGFHLRWFTPVKEVELCGHATLASAHVLWETGALPAADEAVFRTLSGRLSARRRGDWIEMDFPSDPPRPAPAPEGLAEALGLVELSFFHSRLYGLVEVADEAALRAVAPDCRSLERLVPEGLVVTSRAEAGEFDVVSRFFAPAYGIDEDPVTGSAHCLLAPHWAGRLAKEELLAYQASPRGGVVRMQVRGDRVLVAGRAVTVLRGELLA